jgi:class 3 adenylate cyclase
VHEERKTVTCLYADLVGSTAAADRADPEDVQARLAPYHARLRDELQRFGGTVEKFIGDAVVAIFGAPAAHEDDAERAAHAALMIHQAIDELNEHDRSLDLTVRVGIATGEALVQLDVDARSGEGIAAGDVMNVGARLQGAARPGGILVDEATQRATRHAIEYRPTAPMVAKGKAEPLRAWEVVGTRRDILTDRDAPLVGRADELGLLVQALARVSHARRAQLVTIVGVPGIGKSRLVFELFAAAARDGRPLLRLQGRSVPYGNGISLSALAEIAKASSGILETDDADTATTKLRNAVDAVVTDARDARWVAEHLRPLVGLASGSELDADRRTEEFAAWRRWIEALAEGSPVALVFEDLHWADDTLLDFIEHLVEWARDVPLFVVATTRPELFERRPNWGAARWNAFSISLEPLRDEDTSQLVSALLEQAVLPTALRATLLDRSGGNPLYAGQYVRMLADRRLRRATTPSIPAGRRSRIPRRCRASSPPGSTPFLRTRRPCSMTPPCSAKSSGPEPWRKSRPFRAPSSRNSCTRSSARSSFVATGNRRSRISTRSDTPLSATSRTANWRVPAGRPSINASRSGSSRSRATAPTTRRSSSPITI